MDRQRYFALRLDGRLIIAALLGFVLVLGVRVYRHTGEFTGFASLRTSRPSLLPVSRKLLSCGSVRVGLQVHWESRLEASGVFSTSPNSPAHASSFHNCRLLIAETPDAFRPSINFRSCSLFKSSRASQQFVIKDTTLKPFTDESYSESSRSSISFSPWRVVMGSRPRRRAMCSKKSSSQSFQSWFGTANSRFARELTATKSSEPYRSPCNLAFFALRNRLWRH